MIIIGCDYHPSWQQICWVDTETGETGERKLEHASGEAEKFYRQLPGPVLIGMESTGNASGLWTGSQRWGTSYGLAMPRKFVRRKCVNRSTIGETPR